MKGVRFRIYITRRGLVSASLSVFMLLLCVNASLMGDRFGFVLFGAGHLYFWNDLGKELLGLE